MAHLSYEQRYTIEILLQAGEKKSSIAKILKVNNTVIYREISRNCDARNYVYKAKLAQSKYEYRMKSKSKAVKFDNEFKRTVTELLDEDYSPEQIAGVLKKGGGKTVSTEWIYQFV